MKKLIYSTDSRQALLKDLGPFKIFVSDLGLKGQKIIGTHSVSKGITVGKTIRTETIIINTIWNPKKS
jgi:hypothetical protein